MSIIGSNILAGAAGSGVSAYEIEQSLRFDGSSYLLWTPSSTGDSVRKWTISLWVKQNYATGSTAKYMLSAGPNTGSDTAIYPYTYDLSVGGQYYFVQGDATRYVRSVPKYRDESAWYHMVFQSDADNATTGDKLKIFVNGERITTDIPGNAPITQNTYWNSANQHRLGRVASTINWTGYMAEFHSVDNQLVDPDQFGEYDDNGVWRPIEYTGTYGSNGFYLKFDPSATNGIGHDHSGNGNNWTPTGFTTSGTGTDVMSDTPTNNWCTLNSLRPSSYGTLTLSEGNLKASRSTTSYGSITTTIGVSSGKWYWEVDCTSTGFVTSIGITENLAANGPGSSGSYTYHYDGTKYVNGSNQSYSGNSYATGDLLGFALDMDAGTLVAYKDGTSQGTLQTGLSGTFYPFATLYGTRNVTFNFGQRAFEQTVPTGYSALNTSNLPEPAIADGSQHMMPVLWTGTGSARTQAGYNFQPDLLWIMRRDTSGMTVRLHDVVRGDNGTVMYRLQTNDVNAEDTDTDVTGLTSTGFTIGNDGSDHPNILNATYVGWGWKAAQNSGSSNTNGTITSTVSANATAGFSIVAYTGDGDSAATVGHGLGVAPNFVIVRRRTGGLGNWQVGADSIFGLYEMYLNTTDGITDGANEYSVTSTVIDLNSSHFGTNASGSTYVAYCFANVEGYSKFGTYPGNGSSEGAFVFTGFAPAFILVKNKDDGESWLIFDTTRKTFNENDTTLSPNVTSAEVTSSTNEFDILSNGFKPRNSSAGINQSGREFLYAAFAEHPFGGSGVSPATAR